MSNKDINPYLPLIEMLSKWMMGRPGGLAAPKESYGGPLSAGWSPQTEMARQLMAQRAASGGPAAWGNVQNFANMYGGGMTQGVFNPFTGQTQRPQMPGGGGGRPPMGMGGGGGMNPMMMMMMQMMQQGRGGGQPPMQSTRQPARQDEATFMSEYGGMFGSGGRGAGPAR